MSVGSHGSGRTEWKDSRSVHAVEESTAWNDSFGCSRNGVGQMSQEEGAIYAHAVGKEMDVGTAGSKRRNLADVDACRQATSSGLACRWVSAQYMRRRG
jgi:hypothetical protein